MKYFYKLKKYSEIKFVIDNGEKIILKSCIIYKLEVSKIKVKNNERCVIAFLLSKKFGKANKRNIARRLLFAGLTKNASEINKSFAYVFIPRAKVLSMTFEKLVQELSIVLS